MLLRSASFNLLLVLACMFSGTAAADVFNKEGSDVRLLAAHFDNLVVTVGNTAANIIDPRDCRETARAPQWHHGQHIYDSVSLDCAAAVTAKLGKAVIGGFSVYLSVKVGTLDVIGDSSTSAARLVNLYTVTRKETLAYAEGIGFYFRWGNSFVPKEQLTPYTDATMQHSGDAAVVHQFAALLPGGIFEGVSFKPFMQFAAGSDTWRVWEDLSSRRGIPGYEPGIWGSGNYSLKAFRLNSVLLTDLINESDLIKIEPLLPVIGQIHSEYKKTEIVTVSVYPDRRSYEVALFPYVSSTPLYLKEDQAFAVAGTKLWVRFSDEVASGRDVTMHYRLNDGEDEVAANYMGGNCYGFRECFAVPLPAEHAGAIEYWFTLTAANGRTDLYRDGDRNFRLEIRPEATATVSAAPDGVAAAGVLGPDGAFAIRYDPRRAIELLKSRGKVADEIALEARVISTAGETSVPLGYVRSWRSQDFSINYSGQMALLPVLAAGAIEVNISVSLRALVNGIDDGTYSDDLGTISLP